MSKLIHFIIGKISEKSSLVKRIKLMPLTVVLEKLTNFTTSLTYTFRSVISLIELAIRVSQCNVANKESLFLRELFVRLHDKLVEELIVRVIVANWHHDYAAWVQLVDKGLWNLFCDSTCMDNIVGRSI